MNFLEMKWNYTLIMLSFCTSVFGSWCSLVMIEQAIFAKWTKTNPTLWIVLAGIALGGCGIWTMHFVGMAALDLGIPFSFNIGLAIFSLFCAIISVTTGLYIALEKTDKKLMFELMEADEKTFKVHMTDLIGVVKHPTVLFCGVLVASGVLIMHYVGMTSVVIQADVYYMPGVLVASILIALFASTAAIILVFFLKGQFIRPLSSIVMGIAVCTMHYTGMHAMMYKFNPTKIVSVHESPTEMATVALVLSCLLCIAIQALASVQASGRVKLYNGLLKRNEALKSLRKRLLLERAFFEDRMRMFTAVHWIHTNLDGYNVLLDVAACDPELLPKPATAIKAQFEDLKSIFDHPLRAELLKMQCLKESTMENYAFIQAFRAAKTIPPELKGQITEAMNIIIREFLKTGSRFEINITKECKAKIIEKGASGAELTIADMQPAHDEVMDLLRNNTYRTFCNTPEGILSKKLAVQFPMHELPEFTDDLNEILGSDRFTVDGGSSRRRSSVAASEIEKATGKLTSVGSSTATEATSADIKVKPLVDPGSLPMSP